MAALDRRGPRALALACLLAGLFPSLALAQDAPTVDGETFTVLGVTETVDDIMARDALLPLGALLVTEKPEPGEREEKEPNPDAPDVPQWPPADEDPTPPLLRRPDPLSPQAIGVNFHAIQVSESGFIPPDSMGAVGPTQIVVVANGRIKVFSKTGVLGPLNTTTDNFFASVRLGGTSDPHVRYDRLSQRWFVVMIDVGACGNKVLMAVSSGPTITGAGSFTFFAFVGEPNGANPHFTDYPTLGVDASALYIGGNMFDTVQVGCAAPSDPVNTTVWVVNKASIMGGGPATVTAFRNLVNYATSTGGWTLQGADNDNPAATQGLFAGVDFFVFSRLVFYRVNNPGGVPTLTGPLNLTVPVTVFPQAQPQPAGGPTLDALDDRLFAAAIRRNKITGAETLWTAHNIEVDAGGTGNATGNRNGSRWYEVGNLSGAPSLVQAGTLFDPAAVTPVGYWIPSVASSGQGHMALGANSASSAAGGFAGIAAAGRLRTDPLGTTQAPTNVITVNALYDQAGGPPERWGDYSQTVVDPNDDQTLWTFQEYVDAVNSWGVRVAQLRAPLPATPASAAPPIVAQGQASVNVVVTGTSISGSEFFDPGPDTGGPGFANRIAAAFSGGVTVNSVTFNSPTQITVNISTVGTPAGAKDLTVTNPDGQTRTAVGILTVTGCGTITVNPASIPAGTAGTPYSQAFSQTGGGVGIVWSVSGTLPAGLTLNPTTGILSGTPTQTGSFPITITATDSANCSGSRAYTLVVNCPTITVNPSSLPAGTVGAAYSQTFTQTGGIGTVTWSVTGTLPTGVTLNPTTGVLSGTPTQPGSFPISITATDANGCTGVRAYTLVINCQAITVNPSVIGLLTAGVPFSQTFTQSGGIGAVSWVLTGTPPPGLTFNSTTGVLSGSPTTLGTFSFTVTATDANGCTGSRPYNVTVICQTVIVNPPSIPPGTAGSPYSQTFSANTVGTATWSVTGTLPAGLALNPSTGVLSGTPTQTGSFPITVSVSDANGCSGSRPYTLVINCQTLTVNPATIPAGTAGTAYSQAFTQTGGIGTITWSVAGTLPTGVTLNPTTGVLSGTPTQTGSFPITVRATDANGCFAERAYTLVINCATITIDPPTIPSRTAGSFFSQSFTQTGGIGTVTWSVTGTLPPGVTLNTATGALFGTPTQTGSFPITITATDGNNCVGSRAYTLVIVCQTIIVNPGTIPAGTAGTPYSQAFTQQFGVGTVTWSVTGTLPTGVTMNPTTGVLSGTPTQTGIFPITVTATDANGCPGSRAVTLIINCQTLTVNPATIPAGTAGTAYSQTFTQTGGIGTVTWSVTGTLPTGVTLNPTTGVLSGTPTQTGSFPISITATDANNCPGTRAYTLVINRAGPFVPTALAVDVPGNRVFEPGETVAVEPSWRNDTGAAETITGTLGSFTGPAGATYTVTDPAAVYGPVAPAAVGTCASTGDCYGVSVSQPPTRPVQHWDATALETLSSTDTKTWRLHIGSTFSDVTTASGFYRFVETIIHKGVTGGCSPTTYCPASATTREQMAVFVLLSKEPSGYLPPPCGATPMFADVPVTSGFCRWIEELARRGVVGGCGGGNYCPAAPATRDAMAVFVLRTLDPALNPPPCGTPMFADVPASNGFCRWIEELARRGVVSGCGGGNYCPTASVTREQMSVFLTVTFGLVIYAP